MILPRWPKNFGHIVWKENWCSLPKQALRKRPGRRERSSLKNVFFHANSSYSSRTNLSDLDFPSSPHSVVINTPRVKTSGFLGAISYRTAMSDSQNQPDQLSGLGETEDPLSTHTIESRRLELGLQVVAFLCKHSATIRILVERIYSIGRTPVLPKTLGLAALDHLWDIIDDCYHTDTDSSRLEIVIRIFQNSYQPLPITRSTKVDELNRFISGENVRWETICNMLVLASISLLHIPNREIKFIDPSYKDTQSLLAEFYEINDSLQGLTESSFLNELVVCLKFNQILYAFIRFGESSPSFPFSFF